MMCCSISFSRLPLLNHIDVFSGHVQGFVPEKFMPAMQDVGVYFHHIITRMPSELARLTGSVDGLSDALRVIIMTDEVAQSVHGVQREKHAAIQQFHAYRMIVDATRLLSAPDYFLGKGFVEDAQRKRWFEISSRVFGLALSIFDFVSFAYQHGVQPFLHIGRRLRDTHIAALERYMDGITGVAAITVCGLGAIESIRDIVRGEAKSIAYSALRAIAQGADSAYIALKMLPGPVSPLVAATCGLVAASCGLSSFFMDPAA